MIVCVLLLFFQKVLPPFGPLTRPCGGRRTDIHTVDEHTLKDVKWCVDEVKGDAWSANNKDGEVYGWWWVEPVKCVNMEEMDERERDGV